MPDRSDTLAEARRCSYRAEQREFAVALKLGFTIFLVVALVSRLLPRAWRPDMLDGSSGQSVLAEARRAAHTLIPMAFLR